MSSRNRLLLAETSAEVFGVRPKVDQSQTRRHHVPPIGILGARIPKSSRFAQAVSVKPAGRSPAIIEQKEMGQGKGLNEAYSSYA